MKTFKTFLFEEMTANNMSISDIAPQITDTPKDLNFTSPTGPSTKPTKPVGKENTKKPNNKRDDDDDSGDDTEPDFDTWLANHPMPGNRDADGDGIVTDSEQEVYNQAWNEWRDSLIDWMLRRQYNQQPSFPENDEPYIPGEWNNDWEHWYRDVQRTTQEYLGQPGDPPLNLPFDMSKEDYEMWKDLLRIRGMEAREIFDWIWRYYRAGQHGFPNVESPVWPGENPLDDPWSEPLFPNSSPGPARRPGEHHA